MQLILPPEKRLILPPRRSYPRLPRARRAAPLTPQGPGSHTGLPMTIDESSYLSNPTTSGTITRTVFLADVIWPVPAGVTSIDILAVGGGGDALDIGVILGAPGGGGGGGIRVTNGVVVAPGNNIQIAGVSVPGSNVTVFNLTTATQLSEAASGGDSSNSASLPAAGNGSGGGGSGAAGLEPGGLGLGTGNDGGLGNIVPALGSGAGGGGAGANGGDATAVAPGNGGAGAVPPPSSFGAWGADIGEGGIFGGGGGGLFEFGPVSGTRGIGGGAANTGGGATATGVGDPGFSGIVVFMYLLP